MSDRIDAYPLTWPPSQPRTRSRQRASFGRTERTYYEGGGSRLDRTRLTVAQALERLTRELRLVGAVQVVVSTNLQLRLDGLPRSGQGEPADPGVAVYFSLDQKPHCLACDTWDRVADNLAAIAKHIEALRGQERWGVGSRAQAFAGYAARPASTARPWRQVLEVPAAAPRPTEDDVRATYRRLAFHRHPDHGGSTEAMAELNAAMAEALAEIKGQR